MLKLNSTIFLFSFIVAQSYDGILNANSDIHPCPKILLDSMRIDKDSCLYVFSNAQSEEYLCMGNVFSDIADDSNTVASSRNFILLDSFKGRTVFISTYFSLDQVRKADYITIKAVELKEANEKVHNRLWLTLVTDSLGSSYLKDPRIKNKD